MKRRRERPKPLWLNQQQMREVARLCNPAITDAQFKAMWAERVDCLKSCS